MNKQFITKFVIIFSVIASVVGTGVALSKAVLAETGKNSEVTLSPTSTKLTLEPGEEISGKATVFNSGDEKFTVNVYASPYQVANSNYDPVFETETNQTQISRWIDFERSKFDVEPGQSADINWTINVPEDAPAGGQYATIFAEASEGEANSGSTGVEVKKRVGTIIYATVNGETRQQGSNSPFRLPKFIISRPISTKWTVENTGNTDFEVEYDFVVENSSGDELFNRNKTLTVLPDTSRDISVGWVKDELIDGDDIPPSFGVYRAKFSYSYLGSSETLEQTIVILQWWHIAVGALAVAVIIAVVVLKVKKSRSRRRYGKR